MGIIYKLFFTSRLVCFLMKASFEDVAFDRGWHLLKGGVFPNGWLKVRHSIEGSVNQMAVFIRGNTVLVPKKTKSYLLQKSIIILS